MDAPIKTRECQRNIEPHESSTGLSKFIFAQNPSILDMEDMRMQTLDMTQDLPVQFRAPQGRERRRSNRQALATIAALRTQDSQEHREGSRQVQVLDVSLHGIGFRSGFPLEIDQIVYIDIGAGPLQLASEMRIVRSNLLDDGSYDCGAEFC
jgi:hypothetical protein